MNKAEGILLVGLLFVSAASAFMILSQGMKIAELQRSLEEAQRRVEELQKSTKALEAALDSMRPVFRAYRYNITVELQEKVIFGELPVNSSGGGLAVHMAYYFYAHDAYVNSVVLTPMVEPIFVDYQNYSFRVEPLLVIDEWGNSHELKVDCRRYDFYNEGYVTQGPFYSSGEYWNATSYIKTYYGILDLVYFKGYPTVSFYFDWDHKYDVDLSVVGK